MALPGIFPDLWKEADPDESPRHYFEPDRLPAGFDLKQLSPDLPTALGQMNIAPEIIGIAPWAIMDAGFVAVISSYFADIFYNNSLKNGLLPVLLQPADLSELFDRVEEVPSTLIRVDLPSQTVTVDDQVYSFTIDPYRKVCLLEGLDDLSYLLRQEGHIAAYEEGGRS